MTMFVFWPERKTRDQSGRRLLQPDGIQPARGVALHKRTQAPRAAKVVSRIAVHAIFFSELPGPGTNENVPRGGPAVPPDNLESEEPAAVEGKACCAAH